MEDPERAQPAGASNFSSRTSHILKKVSAFRTSRRKSDHKEEAASRKRESRRLDMSHSALRVDGDQDSPESSKPSSHEHTPHPAPAVQVAPPPSADPLAKPDARQPTSTPPRPTHGPSEAPTAIPSGERATQHASVIRAEPAAPESNSQPSDALAHQRTLSADAAALLRASPPYLSLEGATHSLPSRGMISPAASIAERRNLAPRLATLPPPMMARYNERGAARLTPSIGPRQPPMPLLNLPTLPLPTPQPSRPGSARAPLRSMPALPMQGSSDAEQDADHESASLGDSDSDEDMDEDADVSPTSHVEEDEEDEDGSSPGHPSESGGSSSTEAPLLEQPTPRLGAPTDYFTAKTPSRHPSQASLAATAARTPRPADFFPPAPASRAPLLGSPTLSPRPGLYQQGSRSMVNLLATPRKSQDPSPSSGAESPRKSRALQGPPTIHEDEPSLPAEAASPTLRRQRSLPIYKASSEPPPYPTFHPRGGPPILPREEEGREQLPEYTSAIYLCAVMPRKLEFSAPGVQARDRKWRRVLCVLDGTVFRVYKCPPAAAGVNALEAWWEDKVGVGDHTNVNPAAVTANGFRVSAVRPSESGGAGDRDEKVTNLAIRPSTSTSSFRTRDNSLSPQQQQQQPQSAPPTRSRFSAILHPTRTRDSKQGSMMANSMGSRSRMSMDSHDDAPGSSHTSNSDAASSARSTIFSNYAQSSSASQTTISNANSSPPSRSNSGDAYMGSPVSMSQMQSLSPGVYDFPPTVHCRERNPDIREPDKKDMLNSYTLQHAESGLASDYTKRKNVIRVRFEGEQFLFQAADVAAVIDWIEGIQAATGLALDLDERPMPKGPMFPRRRRRRRAAQNGGGDRNNNASTQDAQTRGP